MGRFATDLTLTVPAARLLDALKDNRIQHKKDYREALEKFKETSILELEARAHYIKEGEFTTFDRTFHFDVPIPVDYTSSYDEVIEMLEFSEQEEIEVTGSQYRAWVKDNWDWSHNFASNTLSYKTMCSLQELEYQKAREIFNGK